jgi:hypothetical protein
MAATRLGVFEALASGPLTAHKVAAQCGTDPHATEKLLTALAGVGYLRADQAQYALAPIARKWLLKDSPQSLRDKMLIQFTEWEWIEGYEEFVDSGTPLDIHGVLSDDEWGLYQRSMRALASGSASEVARRTPVPNGARDMLDIGGSHGYYSVAICRRHPGLLAVVLDLPEAVKHAEPILAREEMGDRVMHRAGNALTDDLGTEAWDLVFIANLMHHFDEKTNRDLVRRIARPPAWRHPRDPGIYPLAVAREGRAVGRTLGTVLRVDESVRRLVVGGDRGLAKGGRPDAAKAYPITLAP